MNNDDLDDFEAIGHFLVVARHQGTWLAGVLPKEDALLFAGQETDRPLELLESTRNPTNPNLSACRPDQSEKNNTERDTKK